MKNLLSPSKHFVYDMEMYHYTSLRGDDGDFLLKKILNSQEILLRATYFENFAKEDYKWLKKDSRDVVRRVCEENGQSYDPDMLDCRPYIISFSTNGKSAHLWKKFGCKGKGMILAFDSDKLNEAHATDGSIDCLLPCKYITRKKNMYKRIQSIANHENLTGWPFVDCLKMAVVAMRPMKKEKEEEMRYISLHQTIGTINEQGIYKDYEVTKDEWYKYITFPKDSLVSIILGSKTKEDDYQFVKDYVKQRGLDPNIVRTEK